MKIKILTIVLIFYQFNLFAQNWSFGSSIGFTINPSSYQIHAEIDSVVIDGNNANQGNSIIGIFANYSVNNILSLRGELNYINTVTGFAIFNQYKPDFTGTPTMKAGVISQTLFEIPIMARLKIPFNIPKVELGVTGGINMHITFSSKPDVYTEFRNLPEVSRVWRDMYDQAKPVIVRPTIGAYATLFDRFEVNFKYTRVNDYVKDITYNGENYPIATLAEYYCLSFGYRFYSFKFKNSRKETKE